MWSCNCPGHPIVPSRSRNYYKMKTTPVNNSLKCCSSIIYFYLPQSEVRWMNQTSITPGIDLLCKYASGSPARPPPLVMSHSSRTILLRRLSIYKSANQTQNDTQTNQYRLSQRIAILETNSKLVARDQLLEVRN